MAELLDFGLVPSFHLRKTIAQLLEGFPSFLNLALILSALLFVVEAKLAQLAFEMRDYVQMELLSLDAHEDE